MSVSSHTPFGTAQIHDLHLEIYWLQMHEMTLNHAQTKKSTPSFLACEYKEAQCSYECIFKPRIVIHEDRDHAQVRQEPASGPVGTC